MRKEILIVFMAAMFVLGNALQSQAVIYTGCLANNGFSCPDSTAYPGDGGLFAAQQWGATESPDDTVDSYLYWAVSDEVEAGKWAYEYTWHGDIKELSHILFEVSNPWEGTFFSGTTSIDDGPKIFTAQPVLTPGSNPGLPINLYGIKFGGADTTDIGFTIFTEKAPMWGDVYIVDGKNPNDILKNVYAYNTGIGYDVFDPLAPGNNAHLIGPAGAQFTGAWTLVPDTVINGGGGGGGGGSSIPEPGTILLLGGGLLGLALHGRGRKETSQ